MKWSIRLGSLFGIPVYVHVTFFLLVAWLGSVYWARSGSLSGVAEGVIFLLALFGCVLLHELGHALAARRFGIGTSDITLLPIGGVARLERMPERPAHELVVALAGPAVNVAIAAALAGWLLATRAFEPVSTLGVTEGSFVERLMVVNLFLVGFNLLPAFPMDGGRVLRAALAMRLDYARATRLAAGLGQAMAVAFGFVGLLSNPFLLLIALFVWIGAAQESSAVQARSALAGVPVGRAMRTDYRTLDVSAPLQRAVDLVLAGSQRDFPVVEEGRIVGVLTQRRLLERLSREGPEASVGRGLGRDVERIDVAETLDVVVPRMQASGAPLAPVVRGDRLVGVLTTENVLEFLSIRRALGNEDRGGETRPRRSRPTIPLGEDSPATRG